MTIRKNTANFFRLAATAVEQAKVPASITTVKAMAKEKMREYRIRAAALVMPQDVVLVVESDKL